MHPPCPICGGNCSLTLPPIPDDYPFLPAEEIAAMNASHEPPVEPPPSRRQRTLTENRMKPHDENNEAPHEDNR